MPIGFGRGWRVQAQYVRLGLVQGQLRMSQVYRFNGSSCFLKVWELIYNEDYNNGGDNSSTSWLLVHDVKVDKEKTEGGQKLHVIAFHPENGDVIFLLRGADVYKYEIGSNKCEKVWEVPISDDRSGDTEFLKTTLNIYPVMRSCLGPTKTPELQPI